MAPIFNAAYNFRSMKTEEALGRIICDEMTGCSLFVALLMLVYTAALAVAIKIGYLLVRHKGSKIWSKLNKLDYLILSLASLGLVCFAWGVWVEPYWPEVTTLKLVSHKLKPGSRTVRLVHISDLHCDDEIRLEKQLPELIAKQKPDAIVFTGDSINSKKALGTFRQCMSQLAQIAPTFVVQGNHDSRTQRRLSLFKGTGVKELNGTIVPLKIGGAQLTFSGMAVDSEYRLPAVLNKLPADTYNVFLYHFPAAILDISQANYDLFCAGHTHGGQVRLPFYGAIITKSKTGKRFEAGPYKVNDTWLNVNRGIGMEGGIAPRVRFLTRPEISVIEISPAKDAQKPGAKPKQSQSIVSQKTQLTPTVN
jgi:predicted MPP superfamily phosphohydrolase